MVSTIPKKEYKTIFVLDNDECIGSWGIASAFHHMFSSYIQINTGIPLSDCLNVLKQSLINHYFSNGGARPGTKDILKLIKFYKDSGMIDGVAMFTSATNKYGWVNFLKDCLEQYADVVGIYDIVLHNDNTKSDRASDGSILKCMDLVINNFELQDEKTSIIVIDDKPHNIVGDSYRIGVSPYRHIVEENHISEMIDEILDVLQGMYIPVVGKKTYSPSSFRKTIKDMFLVDKNGRKQDVYDNLYIHKCPVNQMNDKDLIEKGVKAIIEYVLPHPLVRSITKSSINIKHINLPNMKRSLSL